MNSAMHIFMTFWKYLERLVYKTPIYSLQVLFSFPAEIIYITAVTIYPMFPEDLLPWRTL